MAASRVPLSLPPGLNASDTAFADAGGYRDGSNVRFRAEDPRVGGRPEVIGGWERLTLSDITGLCRNVLPWTDNKGALNIAFASHSALQVLSGGALYDVTPAGLAAGLVDGIGGQGFGTGGYSTGGYSQPSTADYFPRTWALSAYGQSLVANPRGGPIYQWTNNPAAAAFGIPNAPANVTYALSTPQLQIMALGCNQEADGVFNPLCVRHSSVRDVTEWSTGSGTSAREYVLEGGGRIVAGRLMGDYVLVWTDSGLHLGSFVGELTQPWRFDPVARNCGLIGPNAAVVVGQTAYWIAPSGRFHRYPLGGEPEAIPSPLAGDMIANLADVQQDKIVLASVSAFREVWAFYPDARDGLECSRAISVNLADGSWSKSDSLARTAFADAEPARFPIGVSPTGAAYWHERGRSADGDALAWCIETADQMLGDSEQAFEVQGFIPDFKDQLGGVRLTVITRMEPQGVETAHGPYALTSGQTRVDFRCTARLARVRFEGASSPASLRLGQPMFLVQARGRR